MNKLQFEKAFSLGLGRAYLYVREHGDNGLQDIILRYSLKNSRHDAQGEDARAPWLMSVIELCDRPKFYHDKIIAALFIEKECWSLSQLFDLCLILAKKGNKEAEQAIFNRFDKQDFEESWHGTYEIVDLKGIEGLTHVARVMGQKIMEDENYWDGGAYSHACEIFGEDNIKKHLESLSKNDPAIATFLKDALESEEIIERPTDTAKKETLEERIRRELPIEKILTDIENGKFYRRKLTRFGKCATDDEIGVIYNKILNETREKQLISYLWIFDRRDIPICDEKIKSLVYSSNERLRYAVFNALSRIKSPEIRDLAISLHGNAESIIFAEALNLFRLNYVSGDYKYIDRALVETQDDNLIHEVCLRILDIFDAGHYDELYKTMLWAYGNTPCSYCRSEVVRRLSEENLLPDKIKGEGIYDCCEDTKKLCG